MSFRHPPGMGIATGMIEQQTAEKSAENPIRNAPAEHVEPRLAFASRTAAGVWLEIYDNLSAIEPVWRAFEAHADCTVFQRFDYAAAWQKHIGARKNSLPLIAVIRGDGEEVLCIAPLALDDAHGCKRLRWLAQDNSDYCAPLLAADFERRVDSRSFAPLWNELCNALGKEPGLRFDLADFRKMPEMISAQRNPFLSLPVLPNPSNAHLTKIWGDWEKFYTEKRSSATRRRDRTKRKRLGEFGEVRMVTPADQTEIAKTFDGLVEQKSAALARMGVSNLFAEPGVRDFYFDLATNARTHGFVHVSKLEVGNCQASTNLGFEHRGRYYYVFASYDAGEASKFGPGAAHLRDLMQRAIERGLHEFDFTIGDERYKSEWADTEMRLYDHMSAQSWRGQPWAVTEKLMKRSRRAIKQNAWLWSFVLKGRALLGKSRGKSAEPSADN